MNFFSFDKISKFRFANLFILKTHIMRAQWFFNTPDEGTTTDTSGDTTPTTDPDDPGRTDTDTIPKKKAE